MRVAAFDTSTWWGGVALVEDGEDGPRVVAEAGLRVAGSHARTLLGLFEAVLAAAGWSRGSSELFAAARGPGSFTGVRIALGTVRGRALAADRPALGIGTLDALAAARGREPVDRVALLDAGRGEVFGARFDGGSFPPAPRGEPWVGEVERAFDAAGEAVLFGPGADRYRERLAAAGAGASLRDDPRSVAAAVGRLAAYHWRQGSGDGWGLHPLYVRGPDAVIRPESR